MSRLQTTDYRLQIKIIFLFAVLCLLLSAGYAQPISSRELINHAKEYDGKTVVYEGEVIGDVLARRDYAWINVNDAENTIGIWIKASLAKEIGFTGSYKSKGDIVEITGIFHRACQEHGGDLDIHAQALRKINPGKANNEKLAPGKMKLFFILAGILCAIWIFTLFKKR